MIEQRKNLPPSALKKSIGEAHTYLRILHETFNQHAVFADRALLIAEAHANESLQPVRDELQATKIALTEEQAKTVHLEGTVACLAATVGDVTNQLQLAKAESASRLDQLNQIKNLVNSSSVSYA